MLSGLGLRDPGLGNETEEPQHPNPSFLGRCAARRAGVYKV